MNDMMGGMVLLFELLIVNNWFVLVDGFTSVSPFGNWARIYFVFFYVRSVGWCWSVLYIYG